MQSANDFDPRNRPARRSILATRNSQLATSPRKVGEADCTSHDTLMLTFIGFSPAWQQVYSIANFANGEVIRATDAFSYASGKATNAAIVATRFTGQPVHLATVLGGQTGQLFEADLFRHRLRLSLIRSEPTRVCTTIIPQAGPVTELVQNVASATASVAEEMHLNVRRSRPTAIACSGSLPAGIPTEIYGKLVRLTEGPTIVDASGDALLESLESEPTLVKPNRAELNRTLGKEIPADAGPTDSRLLEAMQSLLDRGARAVLVTDGSRPATLLTRDGLETYRPPEVSHVLNPIGAGDALTGATLVALADGQPIGDAIELGMKAASEKCGYVRPEEIPARIT